MRYCDQCPGYMIIESRANRGFGSLIKVLAVSVPITACPTCQAEAYDVYEQGKVEKKQFDYAYLQDKSTDTYLAFERDKAQEWVSEGPKPGV